MSCPLWLPWPDHLTGAEGMALVSTPSTDAPLAPRRAGRTPGSIRLRRRRRRRRRWLWPGLESLKGFNCLGFPFGGSQNSGSSFEGSRPSLESIFRSTSISSFGSQRPLQDPQHTPSGRQTGSKLEVCLGRCVWGGVFGEVVFVRCSRNYFMIGRIGQK